MNLSDLGTIITVIAFAFAIYQYFEAKRTKEILITQLWSVFHKIFITYGSIQSSRHFYNLKHNSQQDNDVIFWLSRQEALVQVSLEDIILQLCKTDEKLKDKNLPEYLKSKNIDIDQNTKYPLTVFQKYV